MNNNRASVPKTKWFEFSISVIDVRASSFKGYCFWNELIYLTYDEFNQYCFGADGPHLFGFMESIYVTVFRISNNICKEENFTKKNKTMVRCLKAAHFNRITSISVPSCEMKLCALKACVDNIYIMKIRRHNNSKRMQKKKSYGHDQKLRYNSA